MGKIKFWIFGSVALIAVFISGMVLSSKRTNKVMVVNVHGFVGSTIQSGRPVNITLGTSDGGQINLRFKGTYQAEMLLKVTRQYIKDNYGGTTLESLML